MAGWPIPEFDGAHLRQRQGGRSHIRVLATFGDRLNWIIAAAALGFCSLEMGRAMDFASEPWDTTYANPAPGIPQSFTTATFQVAPWIQQ